MPKYRYQKVRVPGEVWLRDPRPNGEPSDDLIQRWRPADLARGYLTTGAWHLIRVTPLPLADVHDPAVVEFTYRREIYSGYPAPPTCERQDRVRHAIFNLLAELPAGHIGLRLCEIARELERLGFDHLYWQGQTLPEVITHHLNRTQPLAGMVVRHQSHISPTVTHRDGSVTPRQRWPATYTLLPGVQRPTYWPPPVPEHVPPPQSRGWGQDLGEAFERQAELQAWHALSAL